MNNTKYGWNDVLIDTKKIQIQSLKNFMRKLGFFPDPNGVDKGFLYHYKRCLHVNFNVACSMHNGNLFEIDGDTVVFNNHHDTTMDEYLSAGKQKLVKLVKLQKIKRSEENPDGVKCQCNLVEFVK